jgi:polyphenol oxidase
MTQIKNIVTPSWPAPGNIKACTTTTRQHGDLKDPDKQKLLIQTLNLPSEPYWLNQVHGTTVLKIPPNPTLTKGDLLTADASYTSQPNTICVVHTADCLPVLICDRAGTQVAAVHAGWRGLAAGIIERTVELFDPQNIMVWLGPAIGPEVYEVGPEVRDQFLQVDPDAVTAFRASQNPDRWLMDLYQLARQRLTKIGVTDIYGGSFCTYTDTENFFSYRRSNGELAGRMASLIYILR